MGTQKAVLKGACTKAPWGYGSVYHTKKPNCLCFHAFFWRCHKHLIRELSIREAALRWQTSAPVRTDGEQRRTTVHQGHSVQGGSFTPQLQQPQSKHIFFLGLSQLQANFPITHSTCRLISHVFCEVLPALTNSNHKYLGKKQMHTAADTSLAQSFVRGTQLTVCLSE